ncbi:MAG: molybdopterin-binding protein [Planctomycetota bacterium]
MSPQKPKVAGIIAIGNEILSGKVTDLNATHLIQQFRELGVEAKRVAIIPDEIPVIRDQVREFSASFDIVITTGGVGPTHDDVTIEAIAAAFNRPIVPSPELEAVIREYFKDDFKDAWLRMARIPEGTELVWRDGMPFPITKLENVWILPGEPSVMRKKFAAIREDFRQTPIHVRRLFTTWEEGDLAELLEKLEAETGVAIGSYPTYEDRDYKVMITLESRDAKILESATRRLRCSIPRELLVRED